MKKRGSSNKYHILLVIRWPVGGIRTFLKYSYKYFDPSIYHFTIFLPECSEHKAFTNDMKCLNPSYITVPSNVGHTRFIIRLLVAFMSNKFDLIHAHGLTAGVYSTILAFLTRTPHILTLHELLQKDYFTGLIGTFKRKILGIVIHLIDLVHVVSNDATENIITYFPVLRKKPSKLVTISSGIDISWLSGTERRNLRGELNLPEDTFLIGYFGRFMPVKGFKYLVDALEILIHRSNGLPKKPVILTFGYGEYFREEMESVRKRGLNGSVFSLPFVHNITSTLRGVDVVAMPSLSEACGLLAMEAIVAGVPIIGTNCSGLREVLKDTPATIVPPANGMFLAKALRKEILNSSRLTTELFREEGAKRFDVRKQVQELKMVMDVLLNS